MKGLNNFHLTLLVGAIVVGIYAVNLAYQPTVETWNASDREVVTPPQESKSPRTLSTAEIRYLFSGQIVEGIHEIQNFKFIHYYGRDGDLISVQPNGRKTKGTWRISDDERLCIHLKGDQEICRGVMQIDGVTKKFVETRSGKTKIVVTFKSFRTGGPGDI